MKGGNDMNFLKGAMMGIVAGAIVGVMNSDSIMKMFSKGSRQVKKMAKKYAL